MTEPKDIQERFLKLQAERRSEGTTTEKEWKWTPERMAAYAKENSRKWYQDNGRVR
jgi:hypothetical protein